MSTASSLNPVSTTIRSFKKLSRGQKMGAGIFGFLVLVLPILVYGTYQQTLLEGSANNQAQVVTPTQPAYPAIEVSTEQRGMEMEIHFWLNTAGHPIDGVQFVVYISDKPEIYSLTQEKMVVEPDLPLSVVANTIEYERDFSRYRITLGAISQNPAAPFANHDNLLLGTMVVAATPNQRYDESFSLIFDRDKTKITSHETGENLVAHLAAIPLAFTPPPTSSPTPSFSPLPSPVATVIPTPLPSPILSSPSPSPSPSVQPYNSSVDVMYKLQGFNGPNNIYSNSPSFRAVMWDTRRNVQLTPYYADMPFLDPRIGTLIFRARYIVSESTRAILYLQPEKHLSVAVPVTITPYDVSISDITDIQIPAGDLTGDYIIDIDDYHRLVKAFNPTAQPRRTWEDLNYDGLVDIDDYMLLSENFDPNAESPQLPGE